ncbi:MAG: L-lactate dehydrogenase [Spirochaetes bacterium]|uniref:L-lactate dehydrogenase n=1 Tax=Candidatus Ornithospirochaeta stercoripullorum TaxID=2840899 RepID=A0A9D9DYY1_9SPIO|nr:L-lactate dehydrogenase [Candidatus Ornithospirochaeta stercoripullorum]
MPDTRKVMLIGCGMVGMSYAYALLNQNIVDELVLVDVNKDKAMGEAMDLNHGLAFASSSMKIYAGDYSDAKDADIVVIAAGVNQKPGESRIDLLGRNTAVFKSIIEPVVASGFSGIFLIATNPVDVMSQITLKLSGFSPDKVIGSGTTLDTARLRYLIGAKLKIDPRNVHAYVIGEHGDSEFVPWSQAHVSTVSLDEIKAKNPDRDSDFDMSEIEVEVREAAQKIIAAKNATYYGIGMALVRITRAIFSNEHSILTISSLVDGEYGISGAYLGLPCIVGREGRIKLIELDLNNEEHKKLEHSAAVIKDAFSCIQF